MIEAMISADASPPAPERGNRYLSFRGHPFTGDGAQGFFNSSCHVNVYNQLLGAIREQRGVVAVVGESGIGKTRLLSKIMEEAPKQLRLVFCPAAHLSFDDLLAFFCETLKISVEDDSREGYCRALVSALGAPEASGKRLLLVIDDAQALGDGVLGHLLRLLRQLREDLHIQLLLAGESPLITTLGHEAALHPLAASALLLRLEPLSEAEMSTFIRWQLKLAEVDADTVFPAAVVRKVCRYGGGVPQRINTLCYRALLLAQQRRQSQVTVSMITEIAREQGLSTQTLPRLMGGEDATTAPADTASPGVRRRIPGWLVGLGVAVVIGGASAFFLERYLSGEGGTGSDLNVPPPAPRSPERQQVVPAPSQTPPVSEDETPNKPPVVIPQSDKPDPPTWDHRQMAQEYLQRGDLLLELGDVAAARQFYQSAVDQGSTAAQVAVGKTFDPLVLEARGLLGVYADPERAAQWYRVAKANGEREAQTRLRALERARLLNPTPGS